MHTIRKKIYYHDTDLAGIVYYANYLKYFEEARTEFLADFGFPVSQLAREGLFFVVKKTSISYRKPALYGQVVEVKTKLTRLKSASLDFWQSAEREGSLLVEADTQMACVDKNFKATAISASFLSKVKNDI